MSETKKTQESAPKKTDLAIKKSKVPSSKVAKKPTAIAKTKPKNLSRAFDETFDRFRSDFENLLFPFPDTFVEMPDVRVPAIDLEDRGKDYLLKAEMPGFKKEDIEINVQDDGVEINGVSGWKYDKKEKDYICKERACETFYRYVDLPEQIKVDEVNANLCDGVLELTLPKKTPKSKKRVEVK